MKKKLCVWLLTLCFVVSLASAESIIDLSGYTDAEIEALLEQVQTEIVNRGIEKTADLPTGQYVGGKDIPAGAYTLICRTDSDHYGIVWATKEVEDEENDFPYILYEFVDSDAEEEFRIVLEEGCVLNLPFSAQLRISTGVLFK